MNGMPKSERAKEIVEWCRELPKGQPFTMLELAKDLGRRLGRTLSDDFSLARHLAHAEDSQITYSHVDERGLHVYHFETPDREEANGLRGLISRQRANVTINRNLAAAAAWEAAHPLNERHRSVSKSMMKMSNGQADTAEAMAEILEELSK